MLFLKILFRNAFRNRLRTGLTILGMTIAILAFGLLRTVISAWYAGVEASSATRLITRNSISLIFPLPLAYKEKIRQVDDVKNLSFGNWFGGMTIAFSPPITEIEATYAVRKDSPLRSTEQVDGSGVRISASEKAGYELYLTRTLRNATLVRLKGFQASIDLFNDRGADALAGLRPMLLEAMSRMSDARLVEGKFMTVNHGASVPRDRRAAAEYLKTFVQEMNASGFVARSIERHGVQGLSAVK